MSNYQTQNRDYEKVCLDKVVMKQLDQGEYIILSATLIKINQVEKKQQRIILVTSKNVYNILPKNGFNNFLAGFVINARIRRKISYQTITGVTVSRHGSQFVLHVKNQHDYRFCSTNMKLKIVQAVCEGYCNLIKKKMPLYYYKDLTLEAFTTTVIDLSQGRRKNHIQDPQFVQPEILNTHKDEKKFGDSTLIFKSSRQNSNVKNFHQFQLLKVLGKGAFGKVMLCKLKGTTELYAIKSMKKQSLIDQQHLEKVRTQRKILQLAKHPFLINLQYSFQSKDKLFFVMKFLRGGQLFKHLKNHKKFTQKQAKFYAAQMYLAIAYLHDNNYIYRDLKPQNILMDQDGYLKLSDYGLAKQLPSKTKTYSFVGTPEYVSPEIITKIGHSYSVDWWSFGILIYQMLFGYPPFYNKDHSKMYQSIINKSLFFSQFGKHLSKQVKDLMQKLLIKNPSDRLGTLTHQQIKDHPWFSDIDWQKLLKKQIAAQFIPTLSSQMDVSYFDQKITTQSPVNSYQQVDHLLIQKYQKQFQGMSFVPSTTQQLLN